MIEQHDQQEEMHMQKLKFIVSGGGTGGHIFPAVAIADALRKKHPDCDILFIGAKDRMEMEKVPKAGYPIEGLWISGIQRKLTFDNLLFPIKLILSLQRAAKILKRFKPNAVIGVGGYASAAVLRVAVGKRIPCLIQEQNSFPGITNKWLAPKVNKICVAYDGMEKFFPKDKIIITGNPVREDMVSIQGKRDEAFDFFELVKDKPVLLITGGSLGARSVNRNIAKGLPLLKASGIQVLWQTGKPFYQEALEAAMPYKNVKVHEFIYKMDFAYAVADLVVARAGAITVSELCIVKKPAILVPFPFASEDHQTKNAMALVAHNAAIHISDQDASNKLVDEIIDVMNDDQKRAELTANIGKLAMDNAADIIADEVLKMLSK
jgi:UDP-N-acetylglucosamine--N-acetylmuramyl-(pentapeptide) pyrophosphoryl-undecaprenol N-acetylglucosamine transferase